MCTNCTPRLKAIGLATANIGLVSDIIACPGLDYCALANARAIPIAQQIAERFADQDRAEAIGEMKIKISGCINACGHHHLGHIGILGVDKKGEEFYQLSLGGSGAEDASLAKILGPALPADKVVDAVEALVERLSGRAQGKRALPGRPAPGRARTFQGGRLCRGSLSSTAACSTGPTTASSGRARTRLRPTAT